MPVAVASAVTALLGGRVETVNSNVVDAVVEVAGRPDLLAVTNSLGNFQLRVPAGAAVRLTASYAGFTDETSTMPAGTSYAVLRPTTFRRRAAAAWKTT